jgi:hypothetical protein
VHFADLCCITYFNIITSLRPGLPSGFFYNGYFEVPLSHKYSHRKHANHQHSKRGASHTYHTAVSTKPTPRKLMVCFTFMTLERLTAVKNCVVLFYIITPCILVGGHRCLGGSMTLRNVVNHLRNLKVS